MKMIGDPIFARDVTGRLKSKVGTIFLRTPGLVTKPGIHMMQRIEWIKHLNEGRVAAGTGHLTNAEVDEEMRQSVDLLFDDQHVLIRPDPNAMDLAFEADDVLQTMVSKRKIRFLNIQDARVRSALCVRGENWRMSRLPCSPEEINRLITGSRTAIGGLPIYFYNHSIGTRFLTLATLMWLSGQPDDIFRSHLAEIAKYSAKRNRFGHPEVDIFPPGCRFKRQAFEALNVEGLEIGALRAAFDKLLEAFAHSVPQELRQDDVGNIEWRNMMCSALISQANAVVYDEVVPGMSPEFYMQIEWLPGARIEKGELIFDTIFEEPDTSPDDPELQSLCDMRAKGIILNYVRQCANIEFINVGRIARSLSIRSQDTNKRTNVYVVQVKESDKAQADFHVLRFQKWCVYEHLDEGKPLLQAIMEAVDYTDYILDRRLGCRQLGMNMPARCAAQRLRETYNGTNKEYQGTRVWVIYFERDYIRGIATDKIHHRRYVEPEFNRSLARLLGSAAAVNMIVGRAHYDKRVMFDDGDEVVVMGDEGLPKDLIVSDHTGTFNDYQTPLEASAAAYAEPVNRRGEHMVNAAEFAEVYLDSIRERFGKIRDEYFLRRRAFDNLFKHQQVDPQGNFAFRWKCVLKRMEQTDLDVLIAAIRRHIAVFSAR
ncbi:MAG: hypothetical protein PHU80_08720 [Kiritimatiellae bacterium]|nr:hypothetical protein [Kiritimatiellia bacterium]